MQAWPTVSLMDFDHDQYGIKIVEVSPGTPEAEPHYSVILRLNTLTVLDPETIELTRGLPGPDTRATLHDLARSVRRALQTLEENDERWSERG